MDASKWDACTADPHQWMRFIECHPGFASYLQAMFSVLAILVAVAVPACMTYFENARRAKERVIHAQNIIVAAAPHVFSTMGRTSQLRTTILHMRGTRPAIGNLREAFLTLQLLVSPVIERLLIPTTDADPATLQPMNGLALHVTAYNNLVNDLANSVITGNEQWSGALDLLDQNLASIQQIAAKLVEFYDAVAR